MSHHAPSLPATDPNIAAARARARVQVARVGARSVVVDAYAPGTLRLLTPRNHGHGAWIYTSTLGGGLVDGDAVALDVDVGPGAAALLTTQGSSRVYRSPRGCESALCARVEDDALLALVPDPVTCFAGARYAQLVDVALAPRASLVLVDALTAGRVARGERWAFAHLESRVVVQRAGVAVLDETILLTPEHGSVAARMGRFDATATMVLLGPALRAAAIALRASIEQAPPIGADVVISVSPLDDGVFVRLASTSIPALHKALRARLAFLSAMLGDDPWARRS